MLFETWPMQEYFQEVKSLREKRWDIWKTIIEIIKSNPETKKAWHDTFLWKNSMQNISNKITKHI
jgi:hypothetical protein